MLLEKALFHSSSFFNGVAPAETMIRLGKSCWLFKNSWGRHTKRNHSFQDCDIIELYLWAAARASSDLQHTANRKFRDLQKSLICKFEADASRKVLNSNASGLPVKQKTKLFPTSLCRTHWDAECLNTASNDFPCLQPTVFSIYSPALSLTEQDMSWYLQNAKNRRIFSYT